MANVMNDVGVLLGLELGVILGTLLFRWVSPGETFSESINRFLVANGIMFLLLVATTVIETIGGL